MTYEEVQIMELMGGVKFRQTVCDEEGKNGCGEYPKGCEDCLEETSVKDALVRFVEDNDYCNAEREEKNAEVFVNGILLEMAQEVIKNLPKIALKS